jgi:hypothetical protein
MDENGRPHSLLIGTVVATLSVSTPLRACLKNNTKGGERSNQDNGIDNEVSERALVKQNLAQKGQGKALEIDAVRVEGVAKVKVEDGGAGGREPG